MNPEDRIVLRMPLEELWDDKGEIGAKKLRSLNTEDIKELLRRGPVHFVVADPGEPLNWVPINERYEFWKTHAAQHISDTDGFYLEDFPNGLVYKASEWSDEHDGIPIVVLEANH